MEWESIIKALTPIVLGILALFKMYLEMKKAQKVADSTMQGVEDYKKHGADTKFLNARLQYAQEEAGIHKEAKKALEKVRAKK